MGKVRSVVKSAIRESSISIARRMLGKGFVPAMRLRDTSETVSNPSLIIATALGLSEPFAAGRFGNTELEVLLGWRRKLRGERIKGAFEVLSTGDPYFSLVRSRHRLKQLGLIPLDDRARKKFYELMVFAMSELDLIGSWVLGENYFSSELAQSKVCHRVELEPYRASQPWSSQLAGKRVMVVHPFVDSISRQYFERRELLFPEIDALPEFELVQYQPPRAHFGEINGADHWFYLFEKMVDDLLGVEFDVAIIGAGPFGLPLASKLKANGRQAIHLGGATQLLFGILGSRWENDPGIVRLRNDAWVYPLESERPPRAAQRLSGFSYW